MFGVGDGVVDSLGVGKDFIIIIVFVGLFIYDMLV